MTVQRTYLTPRSIEFDAIRVVRGVDLREIEEACEGTGCSGLFETEEEQTDRHASEPLSQDLVRY